MRGRLDRVLVRRTPAHALVPLRGPEPGKGNLRVLKLKRVGDCRMFANLCAGSIRPVLKCFFMSDFEMEFSVP